MRKFVSVILIISLAFGVFGCTKSSGREVERIPEGTPWYTVETVEVGSEFDCYDYNIGMLTDGIVGHITSGYVYVINGSYGGYGADEGNISELCLYSDSGELISSINYHDYFIQGYNFPFLMYNDFFVEDDSVKVKAYSYAENTYKIFKADFENSELVEECSLPVVSGWDWENYLYDVKCGDSTLYVGVDFEPPGLSLLTVDASGNCNFFNVSENYPERAPENVYEPVVVSDTSVLLIPALYTGDIFLYDFSDNSFTEVSDEYSWFLSDSMGRINLNLSSDSEPYYIDAEGIKTVNFETNEIEPLVLFENIDINRNDISGVKNCKILELDEDRIVFAEYSNLRPSHTMAKIYIASLSDTNPNIGKIVITTDGDCDIVYEAVYRFNRTDDEYFVRVVPNKYNYYLIPYTTEDEYDEALRESKRNAGNQMMVDLIAGDCPDVVFYVNDFPQLANSNCMMDLNTYYENSSIRDSVFDNLIRASMIGDSLYSIPLQFAVRGIVLNENRFEVSGNGISFSEFSRFVDEYANGKNPVADNQLDFLSMMVANNYDLLLSSDGRIDFSSEVFREIAEYTKTNVVRRNPYDYSGVVTNVTDTKDWFDTLQQIFMPYSSAKFIGFPSCDGRGPMMVPWLSVSVTNSTPAPEGAWRFVCALLDYEAQTYVTSPNGMFGTTWGINSPINREAFYTVLSESVDYYNDYVLDMNNMMGWEMYSYVTTEDASVWVEAVESIDHAYISDSDVEVIIYEEMQAYFAGDKTLDEVINIMNDRVQTVMNERSA